MSNTASGCEKNPVNDKPCTEKYIQSHSYTKQAGLQQMCSEFCTSRKEKNPNRNCAEYVHFRLFGQKPGVSRARQSSEPWSLRFMEIEYNLNIQTIQNYLIDKINHREKGDED